MRIAYLAGILVLLLVGQVSAAVVILPYSQSSNPYSEIHEILADGTYSNLRTLRKETDVEWLPWIKSPRDFRDEQRLYKDISKAQERRQKEYERHQRELDRYRTRRDSPYSVYRVNAAWQPPRYPAPLSTRFVDSDEEPPRVRSYATWNGRPLAGHYSLRHLYREAR